MNTERTPLEQASEGIIRERLNEHTRKAARSKALTIYVHGAKPSPDSPDCVNIVERVMFEAEAAEAIYNQQQADRFEDALVALGGAK